MRLQRVEQRLAALSNGQQRALPGNREVPVGVQRRKVPPPGASSPGRHVACCEQMRHSEPPRSETGQGACKTPTNATPASRPRIQHTGDTGRDYGTPRHCALASTAIVAASAIMAQSFANRACRSRNATRMVLDSGATRTLLKTRSAGPNAGGEERRPPCTTPRATP